MTDKETLMTYRLREADETLADAEILLEGNRSPRSIVNRAHTGKIAVRFAKMLSSLFDSRLEGDYKDFVEMTPEQAREAVAKAREFVAAVKELIAFPN
jgi:uncharacterized protein (UPF0332 family)